MGRANRSVGIIGVGIGGLAAGAYLAKAGFEVTVLEKASTVGGSAGWYVRKGRRFPTGATIAFGLEPGGVLSSRLKELGIVLPAIMLEHPMDVVLADRVISIYRDSERWIEELRMKFPERSERIVAFWNKLKSISDAVMTVTKSGASLPLRHYKDLGDLPSKLLRNPRQLSLLGRYKLSTVGDLLKAYGLERDDAFRQFLDLQLIDAAQTDSEQAALLPSAVALTIYREGSFSLERGLGQISEALAEAISRHGGRVEVLAPVQWMSYAAEEKQWTAATRKGTHRFDIVVNNSGMTLPGLGRDSSEREREDAAAQGWGAFRLDLVVKQETVRGLLQGRELPFAYQLKLNDSLADRFGGAHGPVYITFNEAWDAEGRKVDGERMVTVSVHTKLQPWLEGDREAYREQKEQVMEDLLRCIEEALAVRLRDGWFIGEAGTPRTYRRYIGKAEVGGKPLTVRNAILGAAGARTNLPGVYNAGEQVFPGPGTLSSFLSGYYAARTICRKHKR
ncbi:NAD(P)-binding protein [Paenibacillus sp. TRM 82003]|nr:NAD(P)-binding protein [Paenibacillus sp. TRM 82003]